MVERGELMVGLAALEKCHFLKIFLWKRQGVLGGCIERRRSGWLLNTNTGILRYAQDDGARRCSG